MDNYDAQVLLNQIIGIYKWKKITQRSFTKGCFLINKKEVSDGLFFVREQVVALGQIAVTVKISQFLINFENDKGRPID